MFAHETRAKASSDVNMLVSIQWFTRISKGGHPITAGFQLVRQLRTTKTLMSAGGSLSGSYPEAEDL